MSKLLVSLRSEKNQVRIMTGVAVVTIIVFVSEMALLLPAILMR
ncbi:hypothetical protein B0G69_3139 [Paraburkholderia sp. RAU2J]|nr:hypothetical protein [Paraburkholderia sp. RAU2J]RKT27325.1 hypothetical protein B0G69_3139 [Paraburkholderia sp. RAU2J]